MPGLATGSTDRDPFTTSARSFAVTSNVRAGLVIKFSGPFLFLFAGREVRLPSRRLALLAWGSGNCLGLFLLGLLLLPIASLFASGHVSLLWLTIGYH